MNNQERRMVGHVSLDWHVQYRKDELDHADWFSTPEEAIEIACRLIDDGCDVYGIGFGSLDDSIAKDQIARIYDLWMKVKSFESGWLTQDFRPRAVPDC
jgi:hypothetical protein